MLNKATQFLAVFALLFTVSCASAPTNKSTERKLAEYGLTAANALSTLQQQAAALNKGGILPDAAALKTQEGVKTAADLGLKLIPILRAMDLAGSASGQQVADARDLINQIISTVASTTSAFGSTPAANQLQQLAAAALTAYTTITFEIGKLSISPPAPAPTAELVPAF